MRQSGPFATLIRDAIPGIGETDLRRAREYLNACGMVVNVRGNQRSGQPHWFIRAHWHQGPRRPCARGHHTPPGQPAPPASKSAPGKQPEELAHQPGQDIVTALKSLAQQVSVLQADNDRLRADNDMLSAEIKRTRALMRQIGGEIARQASQLLAGTGE